MPRGDGLSRATVRLRHKLGREIFMLISTTKMYIRLCRKWHQGSYFFQYKWHVVKMKLGQTLERSMIDQMKLCSCLWYYHNKLQWKRRRDLRLAAWIAATWVTIVLFWYKLKPQMKLLLSSQALVLQLQAPQFLSLISYWWGWSTVALLLECICWISLTFCCVCSINGVLGRWNY